MYIKCIYIKERGRAMTGPVANVQVYFVSAVMDLVRVNLPISLTCLCDSAFEQEREIK